MALLTNKKLLDLAEKGGYSVGAFNINNLEILQAIIPDGEAECSPAIIAVSGGAIQYAGLFNIISILRLILSVPLGKSSASSPRSSILEKHRDLAGRRSNKPFNRR